MRVITDLAEIVTHISVATWIRNEIISNMEDGTGWRRNMPGCLWIRRQTAETDVVDVIQETISPAGCDVPNCAAKAGGCSFKRDKG